MTDKATEIAALLKPTVSSMGLELLGIEYLPSPGGAVVRLYIDKSLAGSSAESNADDQAAQDSVTIDDCEAVSREVSAQLDVEDPISGNYTLQVSSPGIDRPLFTPAQFARFKGESAKVGLKLPRQGRRRVQGVIDDVAGDTITLLVDGSGFAVEFDNIDKARLVPDWAALGIASGDKPGKGGKAGGKARNKPGRSGNNKPDTSTNKPTAAKPTSAE